MQVLVEVLGNCLKSECLLMWSAEDTFDTGEGCMRTFHILEVLGSTDGMEVSPQLSKWRHALRHCLSCNTDFLIVLQLIRRFSACLIAWSAAAQLSG